MQLEAQRRSAESITSAQPETGAEDPPSAPGYQLFSARARWLGITAVVASVPLAGWIGTQFEGEHNYLLAFNLVGGVLLNAALVLSVVAYTRVPERDRRFWKLFAIGVTGMLLVGALNYLRLFVQAPLWVSILFGTPMAAVVTFAFLSALQELVRTRSDLVVNPLDLLESAMLVIAVAAFAPLLWGDRPIDTDSLWFTVPAGLAAVGILAGVAWSLATFRRVVGSSMPDELLGLSIGIFGGINALAQTAQGLSGFTLPPAPLLMANAACFGVVVLMPLLLANRTPQAFTTLPPLEQTRTRPLDTIAIALLVPLLVATINAQPRVPWARWYFAGVSSVLLLLAVARGKLAVAETRRLYASIERAAESRRRLLAEVLRGADSDRHRVAAQLHEQATSMYVALTTAARAADQEHVHPSVRLLSEDLKEQAERLRELMVAVQPIGTSTGGPASLGSIVAGFLESLYSDRPPPHLDLQLDPDLELDFITETILMRILQEALMNVAKHAQATKVIVKLDVESNKLALGIIDDGVGFDPNAVAGESGLAYMREFAAHLGGHVAVESKPGRGTTVRAVISAGPPKRDTEAPAGRGRPRLRLISGGRTDATETATGTDPPDHLDPYPVGISVTTEAPDPKLHDVHSRLARLRAASTGGRFFFFKYHASEVVVKDVLAASTWALLGLPLAIAGGYLMGITPDSQPWMFASVALFGAVLVSMLHDLRLYRRRAWDQFDPRIVFAQLSVALLATGAFGVAVDGRLALFGPILLVVLLIGALAGSRPMVFTLWALSVLVAGAVQVIVGSTDAQAFWSLLFFAVSSLLITAIVDVTTWKARGGLQSLEAVADFTAFASGVRDWDRDAAQVLQRIANAVAAKSVVVFERPSGGSGYLRETAHWCRNGELSPFLESELRQLAAQATPDGGFEHQRSHTHTHLFAIAAATGSSDLILAVELEQLGQRDDAVLIAGVSALASLVERTDLIANLVGEARTDPLTGLGNRRQLFEHLDYAIGRAARTGEPFAIAILDLDHFKQFNDEHGHAEGDRALRAFATGLRRRLRRQDVATRYGGEEFCLLLPDTTLECAGTLLDDLRALIQPLQGTSLTFSAGVAQYTPGETADQLIRRADAALYGAKEAGRNRTVLAGP
ncbi:MAG: diguanylate cyclase [Acidimicrobiales bacterium]|nr:diguanylate cyclase [Acidimicrobiales bacterium]